MQTEARTIDLDSFLKWQGLVTTGGHAKQLIQSGQVRVNGQVETRRKRKLTTGDMVTLGEHTVTVDLGHQQPRTDA
ncbi:MAG: RNA-binding S4 domain-containing protein [Anaerolineae bacterium]